MKTQEWHQATLQELDPAVYDDGQTALSWMNIPLYMVSGHSEPVEVELTSALYMALVHLREFRKFSITDEFGVKVCVYDGPEYPIQIATEFKLPLLLLTGIMAEEEIHISNRVLDRMQAQFAETSAREQAEREQAGGEPAQAVSEPSAPKKVGDGDILGSLS